jgi:hypothetical protein
MESFHGDRAAGFPGTWKAAFADVRAIVREVIPDASSYVCLDHGEWVDDEVVQLFVDCLLRGFPESISEATKELAPPSMIRKGGNGQLLDLSEVFILDPQNAKAILEVFRTSDYKECLRMLKQNVRFTTAKRILLPLNTSGDTIARRGGTYWMLAELDITCDEVHLYDWLTGMALPKYEKIGGCFLCLLCLLCSVPCGDVPLVPPVLFVANCQPDLLLSGRIARSPACRHALSLRRYGATLLHISR